MASTVTLFNKSYIIKYYYSIVIMYVVSLLRPTYTVNHKKNMTFYF